MSANDAQINIDQGSRIRFLNSDGELVGTVNGEALAHDGNLYVPVYVREGDRCMVVHHNNIVGNAE